MRRSASIGTRLTNSIQGDEGIDEIARPLQPVSVSAPPQQIPRVTRSSARIAAASQANFTLLVDPVTALEANCFAINNTRLSAYSLEVSNFHDTIAVLAKKTYAHVLARKTCAHVSQAAVKTDQ